MISRTKNFQIGGRLSWEIMTADGSWSLALRISYLLLTRLSIKENNCIKVFKMARFSILNCNIFCWTMKNGWWCEVGNKSGDWLVRPCPRFSNFSWSWSKNFSNMYLVLVGVGPGFYLGPYRTAWSRNRQFWSVEHWSVDPFEKFLLSWEQERK